MSKTPPTVTVAYETPPARAYAAAGHAAVGLLVSLLVAIIPFAIKFLVSGDFSYTALVALLTASGVAALGVVMTFLLKWQSAHASDVQPKV